MKNYLIALFFAMGLMSIHTASASTLMLEPSGPTVNLMNDEISGTFTTGFHSWDLNLDLAGDVTFNIGSAFIGFQANPGSIFTGTFTTMLSAGSNIFNSFSTGPVEFSIVAPGTSAVPVPAAIWLFGSALAGLMGVSRRKSQSRIAAA